MTAIRTVCRVLRDAFLFTFGLGFLALCASTGWNWLEFGLLMFLGAAFSLTLNAWTRLQRR